MTESERVHGSCNGWQENDGFSRRKLIKDRDTILELTAKIQELQNEVNCMNDSRDFWRCWISTQWTIPRYQSTCVFPIFSRSWRNAKPFFWNAEPQRRAAKHLGHAWYIGKRFCKSPTASSSAPYPQESNPWMARGMGPQGMSRPGGGGLARVPNLRVKDSGWHMQGGQNELAILPWYRLILQWVAKEEEPGARKGKWPPRGAGTTVLTFPRSAPGGTGKAGENGQYTGEMGGSSPWTRPSAPECGDTLQALAGDQRPIWGGDRPRRRLRGSLSTGSPAGRALDPRCQSGPSARNSFNPSEGRFSKNYGSTPTTTPDFKSSFLTNSPT